MKLRNRQVAVILLAVLIASCQAPAVKQASKADPSLAVPRPAPIAIAIGATQPPPPPQPIVCQPSTAAIQPLGLCEHDFCWDWGLPQGRKLYAAWSVSPDDVWFGGASTLIHWDGVKWSYFEPPPVASPSPYAGNPSPGDIIGLWGSGADDVWALRIQDVLHFDGHAWTVAFTFTGSAYFDDLSGSAPNDVWVAAGDGAWHWNGATWTQSFPETWITSVWAHRPDDVWMTDGTSSIRHWDGTEWTQEDPQWTYLDTATWLPGPTDEPVTFDRVRGAGDTPWIFGTCNTNGYRAHGTWVRAHINVSCPGGGGGNTTVTSYGTSPDDTWFFDNDIDSSWQFSYDFEHYDAQGQTDVWSPIDDSLSAMTGTSGSDIWAAGDYGAIWHFDGQAWSRRTQEPRFEVDSVWSNGCGTTWAILNTSPNLGWRTPSVWRRDAAGWTEELPFDAFAFLLSGVPGGEPWLFNKDGTIERRVGGQWQQMPALPWPDPDYINAAWGSADDDFWAVGYGLTVHWDGHAWRSVDSGTTADLTAISGSGPDDVWAIGGGWQTDPPYPDVLLHFDGHAWSQVQSPEENSGSVWVAGPGDVWLTGVANGEAGVWRGSPGHWNQVLDLGSGASSSSPIAVIQGSAPDQVWVAADKLYHFDGSAWTTELALTSPIGDDDNDNDDGVLFGLWSWDGQRMTNAGLTPLPSGQTWLYGASGAVLVSP